MPTISKLGDALGKGMAEVVKELQERIDESELVSMMVIAEVQGERRPMLVMRGRFERDSFSALTALMRAKHLVQRRLDGSAFMDIR